MTRMTLPLSLSMTLTMVACLNQPSDAQICAPLDMVRNTSADATPAISECIGKTAGKGPLYLRAGTYLLLTPLIIDRTIAIETSPSGPGPACSKTTGVNCAVLAIGRMQPRLAAGIMPIEIAAPNVRFHSLTLAGTGYEDTTWQRRICLDQRNRPLGGGMRIKADGFEMTNVFLKGASCYTALEMMKGVKGAKLKDNVIGPNGAHNINDMWADGITIHEAEETVITDNVFQDNTDVQLILGGCIRCRITNNRFTHSRDFVHASFAELMLHAWPDTSGDFSGSRVSGNNIDCGPSRRCGYGIMIGGEPWYLSRAYGGTVKGNRIANALMAINVDRLTGAMNIRDNEVLKSGGTANSDCGVRAWPAFNISPQSLKFMAHRPKRFTSLSTAKCLLNR